MAWMRKTHTCVWCWTNHPLERLGGDTGRYAGFLHVLTAHRGPTGLGSEPAGQAALVRGSYGLKLPEHITTLRA